MRRVLAKAIQEMGGLVHHAGESAELVCRSLARELRKAKPDPHRAERQEQPWYVRTGLKKP